MRKYRFPAHMALAHACRVAGSFGRESGNIAQAIFPASQKEPGLRYRLPYFAYFFVLILVISRAAARAAADHKQQVVQDALLRVFPFPIRMPRAQRPDGCRAVVSGIAAAAIFNPDFHGVLPRFSSLPSVDKNILAWVSWFCKFFRFMAICVLSPSGPGFVWLPPVSPPQSRRPV